MAKQIKGNQIMKDRIQRYNVERWASEFLQNLDDVIALRPEKSAIRINQDVQKELIISFKKGKKRVLFLDYDGTLAGFKNKPEDAYPCAELYKILDNLHADKRNTIVLITGRDKETF